MYTKDLDKAETWNSMVKVLWSTHRFLLNKAEASAIDVLS